MSDALELLAAVEQGDITTVRHLLGRDPSLARSRNDDGVSAVLLALYHGQDEILELLLPYCPELDLFEASAAGQLEQVILLLDADPALVKAVSPDGFPALCLATFFGRLAVLELLLDRGAKVDAAARNPMQVRALHSAVAHRDPKMALAMATRLLAHGADPNVAQRGGYTPLHQAAHQGNVAMVALLLRHGANREARSDDGRTALDMALEEGHSEVEALLR